ncbi:MAG: class I SAM-dependent methyltransferase [Bacteroidetes bacterium]|nr:class I SAM-dependent methyltransferase [Bacteroidota bacterium]
MLSVFSKFWPRAAAATPATPPAGVEQVRNFYNDHTDKFMQVYGEIIQAFRTNQVTDYLDYTIQSAELHDGQRILDAGCGVGGPASYFASRLQVDITGVTISDYQVAKSREVLATKELKGTVTIRQGDYHDIDQLFGENVFDRVLFLESFGHSPDQNLLIEKAYKVLKPGGILYIKDLFRREHPNAEDGRRIDHIISAINQAYAYNVADFTGVMKTIRRLNFILIFVKTPEIRTEEFEHLTISNDFQNLFDIGKIISWEDYVFPIDFYEIKVMKPPFDVNKEKHLYFLNRPQ